MDDASLISVLRSSIGSRKRALRFGWSKRTDHDNMRSAIMRCEQFVMSYPNASDTLVVRWCRENSADVAYVVLGGRTGVLRKLLGQ